MIRTRVPTADTIEHGCLFNWMEDGNCSLVVVSGVRCCTWKDIHFSSYPTFTKTGLSTVNKGCVKTVKPSWFSYRPFCHKGQRVPWMWMSIFLNIKRESSSQVPGKHMFWISQFTCSKMHTWMWAVCWRQGWHRLNIFRRQFWCGIPCGISWQIIMFWAIIIMIRGKVRCRFFRSQWLGHWGIWRRLSKMLGYPQSTFQSQASDMI